MGIEPVSRKLHYMNPAARSLVPAAVIASLAGLLAGCSSSYTTPGRAANLRKSFTPAEVERRAKTDARLLPALDVEPLAEFPTGLAVVRIQAAGYRSHTTKGWGSGDYSIVTLRDIESDDAMERLGKLPMVEGVAPVNRLLVSPNLKGSQPLREAAASLHADLLLVYTLDTQFRVGDHAPPLGFVTLGLFPTREAKVDCTASAILLDTRTGYVYGVYEGLGKANQLANGWTDEMAVDQSRKRCEKQAFTELLESFETGWYGVVKRYAKR